ncbi:MAG: FecR domain-containing protein [Myxococcota bacterium]
MTDQLQRHIDELRRGTETDGLSRAEVEASWAAIERRSSSRTRVLVPAIALTGALTAAVVAVLVWPARDQGWYRVAEGARCVTGVEELTVEEGCGEPVLALGRDRVQVSASTRLAADAHGVRLRHGRARFTIERRAAGEPAFEVAVSHGTVRVMGTVFAVEQRDDGGDVALESGRIEMHWSDGSPPVVLAPGERLFWPRREPKLAPRPSPTPPLERSSPDGRDPPRRDPEPQTADALMQKQFQLRGQRRYQDAAELLERASNRKDLTKAQRERFSFELGNVLQLDGRDKEACAHWRRHASRFSGSAKKPDVKKALETCEGK